MQSRARRERLEQELALVRRELVATVRRIPPDRLGWAPAPEMKTFLELLREIGTMEQICNEWMLHERELPWKTAVQWLGDDVKSTMESLTSIRDKTISLLTYASDSDLDQLGPALWGDLLGQPMIETEEMFRWIARHEYYHLGQIVSYLWILGDSPYKSQEVTAEGAYLR